MSEQRRILMDDVRFRVMRILHEDPEKTQREIAEEVGISLGRANYVVKALVEKGLIKLSNFSVAKDKRRYAYILTPRGIAQKAAITKRFLDRKIEEYNALKSEIDSLRDELGDQQDEERAQVESGTRDGRQ